MNLVTPPLTKFSWMADIAERGRTILPLRLDRGLPPTTGGRSALLSASPQRTDRAAARKSLGRGEVSIPCVPHLCSSVSSVVKTFGG